MTSVTVTDTGDACSSNPHSAHVRVKRKRIDGQGDVDFTNKKGKFFIAVHLGAGEHSVKKKDKYKALCKLACEKALKLLKAGKSADEAVIAASVVLESSGQVNAGKGSNLSVEKTLECDAGFMNGDGLFGGVGAMPGVPNPILVAKKLADFQSGVENNLSCGRVPPNFLVGRGAKLWAESQGIPTCLDEKMISKKALKQYDQIISKMGNQNTDPTAMIIDGDDDHVNDTVGAVALDMQGRVASTVSSGGNWLKFPGRVGHSPQFGSGCWAVNRDDIENKSAIAISTTGVGEMLAKIHFASECCAALKNEEFFTPVDAICCTVKDKFLDSPILKHHTESKLVGLIALIWDGIDGELVWAHTSKSMVVGYGGSGYKSVQMSLSCLPESKKVGCAVMVEGVRF